MSMTVGNAGNLSSIGVSFWDETLLSPLLEQRIAREVDCLVGRRETEWDLEEERWRWVLGGL